MPNRLADATSPYLTQHSDNPVDWHPWGDEPFRLAGERDVPVFISIGYAACHWCHVMAHESFEDPEVGALLDASFVSVKVDREEHPTVDHFYMSACQAMGVRGGWPLTVLALPDRRPFYCGTYLPKRSRGGRIGLVELLERVGLAWREDRDQLARFGGEIVSLLSGLEGMSDPRPFSIADIRRGMEQLAARFDERHAGFGTAPKFPAAQDLSFLIRCARRFADSDAWRIASRTLSAMRRGGIFDQIGGGLHRYATDREWKLPHFEKMLVDQAFLLTACADAFKFSRETEFAEMATDVAGYVLRDMTAGDGTFFSSEDADSEGVEGRFYLWSWDELNEHLEPEELDHLEAHWHAEPGGNVDDEASGQPTGLNHFFGALPAGDADAARAWKGISAKLMAVRERRERPLRDEKVLTDWNGAMIASLAGAGRATGRFEWIQAAERAARAILATARHEDGRLFHARFGARPSEIGFLDDYSFLVMGLLEIFEATGEVFWLDTSVELSERMIALFWDEGAGSFFLSEEGTRIPVRQRNLFDSAYPAGASIAAQDLLRLDALVSIPRFSELAVRQIEQTVGQAASHGFSSSSALSAADFALGPVREIVVVRGEADNGLEKEIDRTFLPAAVVVRRNPDDGQGISGRMPHLAHYGGIDGRETVYICVDRACDLPVTDVERLREALVSDPENQG